MSSSRTVRAAITPSWPVTAFIVTPTPELDGLALNEAASLERKVRYVLDRSLAELAPEAALQVLIGSDADSAEPAEIRDWFRDELVSEVDFCVFVMTGSSTGVGCVKALAEELSIPTFTARPARSYASPLALGGDVCVFGSHKELADALTLWLEQQLQKILRGELRRTEPLLETEPQRLHNARAWRAMTADQRDQVAKDAGVPRADIRNLLADPVRFAWAPRGTRLALDRVLTTPTVRSLRPLDSDVAEAWKSSIEEYRWSASEAANALGAGLVYEERRREAEAAGNRLRGRPLTTRAAWRRVKDARA